MKYMLMFRSLKGTELDVPPCKDLDAMLAYIGELTQAGVMLAHAGLAPSVKGARVRLSDGKVDVRDGPFTESKELIAGYAMVEVKSKSEAVELAKKFLAIAGEGESEVREVL